MDNEIFFIRHNFDSDRKEINSILEEQNRIAIHFNEEVQTEWSKFSDAAREKKGFVIAWNKFDRLGRKGGIVIAQYQSEYCVIGTVRPKTPIEFLSNLPPGLKTLRITDTKKVYYYDYPLLFVIRPMFSTISPIRENRNYILHIYEGKELQLKLENMHYKMQEQMCEEWLRSEFCTPQDYRLNYPILKTGSYMPAIDICGQTYSGKRLFAQVTYKKTKQKEQVLGEFATTSQALCILFSNDSADDFREGIYYVSLSRVWNDFMQDAGYRQMLKDMVGIRERV